MLVAEAEVRTVVPRGTDIEQQWAQVRGALRAELGDTAFLTWLKPLDVAYMDGDRVVIAVPDPVHARLGGGPLRRPHPLHLDHRSTPASARSR